MKNLGSPMPKQSDGSCLQKKSRVVDNIHVFAVCQIDVLNKKFVSLLSWNNPSSETSLGESYIWRFTDI